MCRCEHSTSGDDSMSTQRSRVVINDSECVCCSNMTGSVEDENNTHYYHDSEDTLKSEHVCTKGEIIINELHRSRTDSVQTSSNHISTTKYNFIVTFLSYLFIIISMLNTLQSVHTRPGNYRDIWLHISGDQDNGLHDNSNDRSRDKTEGEQDKHMPKSGSLKGRKKNTPTARTNNTACLDICLKTPTFYHFGGNRKHEKGPKLSCRMRKCSHLKPFTEEHVYKKLKSTGVFELQERYISDSHLNVFPVFPSLNNYLTRVQNEGRVSQDEEMCYEIRRLQSFSSVPVRTSPMRLAQSGFYATGSGDETRCYSCRMTYSDWRMMDQPDQIHSSMSPGCQHLNNGDKRNVPILSSAGNDSTSVCGVIGSYPLTTGSLEASASPASSAPLSVTPTVTTTTPMATAITPSASTSSDSSDLPGLDISRAVYPQYRDLSSRLDSYQGWGWSHVQDPQVLARAGFYYAGYRDCVRCFYCGVGLRTWEREDDPWVEHVRWRSSCDYVRLMRGEQFAIQALANQDPSVPMASLQQSENNQSQNSQPAVSRHGTDAVTKAVEMGFQRDHIERAANELTGSQSAARDTIQLETLLEKLVLISEEPIITSSTMSNSLPPIDNSYTGFSTPNTQPISLASETLQGSKGSSHMGSSSAVTSSSRNSHTGTSANVTSSINSVMESLAGASVTVTSSSRSFHMGTSVNVTTSINPKTESRTGASVTVTSSEHPATHNSVSSGISSVTNQKMAEPGDTEGKSKGGKKLKSKKTKKKKKDSGLEMENTRVASEETEVSSASQERQLEEENQSMRDESTCKICMDNPSCIVFLPCGHLVTCAECAPALRKCPICRALIRGTVRAHTVSSDISNM